MTDAASATTSDDRLRELGQLARNQHELLRADYPAQHPFGGSLLLGTHYAATSRGILMLGLNPGGRQLGKLYVERFDENCLLPGASNDTVRYWNNARRLFGSDGLLEAMRGATYAFCCPFRTPDWSSPTRTERAALMRHSAPILTQMIADCDPRLIITAGIVSRDVLGSVAAPRLVIGDVIDDGGDAKGTYQWRLHAAQFDGMPLRVAQIPHLSRANAREKMTRCARWLAGVVRDA